MFAVSCLWFTRTHTHTHTHTHILLSLVSLKWKHQIIEACGHSCYCSVNLYPHLISCCYLYLSHCFCFVQIFIFSEALHCHFRLKLGCSGCYYLNNGESDLIILPLCPEQHNRKSEVFCFADFIMLSLHSYTKDVSVWDIQIHLILSQTWEQLDVLEVPFKGISTDKQPYIQTHWYWYLFVVWTGIKATRAGSQSLCLQRHCVESSYLITDLLLSISVCTVLFE